MLPRREAGKGPEPLSKKLRTDSGGGVHALHDEDLFVPAARSSAPRANAGGMPANLKKVSVLILLTSSGGWKLTQMDSLPHLTMQEAAVVADQWSGPSWV